MDRPAERTNLTDQLGGSLYLKAWPARIFEDSPLSLYVVAASESDEGLVFLLKKMKIVANLDFAF